LQTPATTQKTPPSVLLSGVKIIDELLESNGMTVIVNRDGNRHENYLLTTA
jgi:hypothetical protein